MGRKTGRGVVEDGVLESRSEVVAVGRKSRWASISVGEEDK